MEKYFITIDGKEVADISNIPYSDISILSRALSDNLYGVKITRKTRETHQAEVKENGHDNKTG